MDNLIMNGIKDFYKDEIYGVADIMYELVCAYLDQDNEKAKVLETELSEHKSRINGVLAFLEGFSKIGGNADASKT